ncbi:hypothetical protein EYZ11_010431 [Aspergillus tanneri]|uniref:Major facilitator superfamily (MFS) profile domain-containing protein n=1 Tax=Aspergillus tanneri TaxID=1220188 RepID=A0A4S3J5C2_9EURO|nr:hypothetical protein EYZ11_010431 [Aspergillus tanneri]
MLTLIPVTAVVGVIATKINRFLSGISYGLILSTQTFVSHAASLPNDEGATAAMYVFMRNLGAAVGVGIGSSIFQNVMKRKLKNLDFPSEIAQNSEAYIVLLKTIPDSLSKEHLLESYVFGLR